MTGGAVHIIERRDEGAKGMGRRFTSPDGATWEVSIISHGRTSDYLNPRVHRPIVEFRPCGSGATRYAALPGHASDVDALGDDALLQLFSESSSH
jgi:hypothetical protein